MSIPVLVSGRFLNNVSNVAHPAFRSRIVAVISFVFVLLSTIVLVVSTLLEDSHRNEPNCKY